MHKVAIFAAAKRLQEQRRFAEAETLYHQIPRHNWDHEVMNAYAILLAQQGRYAQAEAMLRKVMKLAPDFTAARMNLGNLALERGNTEQAVREFTRLIHTGINSPSLQYNLGRALIALERFAEALEALQSCLSMDPQYRLLPNELGTVLRKLGRYQEARSWYEKAISANPGQPGPWVNIGNSYLEEEDFSAAEAAMHQALAIDPNYGEAWSNLCAIHLRQGLLTAAEQEGRQAVALAPHFAGAYRNLAQVLAQQGNIEEAYTYLHQESTLPGANIGAKLRLIRLLGEHEHYAEALKLEQSLSSTAAHKIPDLALYVFTYHRESCYWRYQASLQTEIAKYISTARLEHGMQLSPWIALLVEEVNANELKIYTKAVANFLFKSFEPKSPATNLSTSQTTDTPHSTPPPLLGNHETTNHNHIIEGSRSASIELLPGEMVTVKLPQRLRIGYLSADFHAHATSYLMVEVFEQHDRLRFEVFAYALDKDNGCHMRQRLQGAFEHWRELSTQSARESADTIRSDAIDLLVDLKGFTRNARPEILVLRPAPIQVSYLGYPGTLGIKAVDYLIADHFIIPKTHRQYYYETIAYLPGCYQANASNREIAAPITRADEHLPAQGLVLCCFNHPRKISPKIFDIWCRVLQRAPGSVLWLLINNTLARENILAEAKTRGIAKQRIIFASYRPQAEHLSRLRLADLFLDTYPVNAHTTASDALYVGVPLITLIGDNFASRVAGSLLQTVGLADLITDNAEDYETLLLRLAKHPSELTAIKLRLVENLKTCHLFNSQHFTSNLENLYLKIWQQHQNIAKLK